MEVLTGNGLMAEVWEEFKLTREKEDRLRLSYQRPVLVATA